jgi:hypothetical protein
MGAAFVPFRMSGTGRTFASPAVAPEWMGPFEFLPSDHAGWILMDEPCLS